MSATAASGFKRPESVLVVVYTRADEVLLLNRRRPSGFWQSVTGSLEPDETPAMAARRELLEETGIRAEPVDCDECVSYPILPAWRARYAPGVVMNTEHLFTICVDDRVPVRLSLEEHSGYVWLSRGEAVARASSPTNRRAIERLAGPA